ncbi:MAG TPA: NUDIX hydrolase [Gemmatimonadaceae bacterium]
MRTERQRSAGGVVVRHGKRGPEVALISVGEPPRWQLPKGIVEEGESPEATAVREVREEAGVSASPLEPLDPIDYWYVGTARDGSRVRYHKQVHFYLMRYESGSVEDHDHEVREARWVPLDEAATRLAFENERRLVRLAATRLPGGDQ